MQRKRITATWSRSSVVTHGRSSLNIPRISLHYIKESERKPKYVGLYILLQSRLRDLIFVAEPILDSSDSTRPVISSTLVCSVSCSSGVAARLGAALRNDGQLLVRRSHQHSSTEALKLHCALFDWSSSKWDKRDWLINWTFFRERLFLHIIYLFSTSFEDNTVVESFKHLPRTPYRSSLVIAFSVRGRRDVVLKFWCDPPRIYFCFLSHMYLVVGKRLPGNHLQNSISSWSSCG